MKKQVLVLALLPSLLTGCGGSSSSETPTVPPNPSQSVVKTFTVTFEGTSIPAKQVNEGGSLEKPSDPVKEGHLFVGWYLDAAFTQEATFPLVIRQNTTLYAQFYSYKTAFAKARENTIGEAVPGYEYDYTLHMSVSYSSFSFSGDTSGRAQSNMSKVPTMSDTMTITPIPEHFSMTGRNMKFSKERRCTPSPSMKMIR